jgi:hypothetical protein
MQDQTVMKYNHPKDGLKTIVRVDNGEQAIEEMTEEEENAFHPNLFGSQVS